MRSHSGLDPPTPTVWATLIHRLRARVVLSIDLSFLLAAERSLPKCPVERMNYPAQFHLNVQ